MALNLKEVPMVEEDTTSSLKTNHGYITFFVLTFLFGSTLQGGWALAECGQVSLVLDKKLGWGVFSRDKSEDDK